MFAKQRGAKQKMRGIYLRITGDVSDQAQHRLVSLIEDLPGIRSGNVADRCGDTYVLEFRAFLEEGAKKQTLFRAEGIAAQAASEGIAATVTSF